MRYIFKLYLILISVITFGQVDKTDRTLMNDAINEFRKSATGNFLLIDNTINSDYEAWSFQEGKEAMSKFKTKFSSKSMSEITAGLDTLKMKQTPLFPGAILVGRFSDEVQRLNMDMMVSDETTKEQVEEMKLRKRETLKHLKPEELVIFHISEPLFDKAKQNCFLYLFIYEIGLYNSYVIFYQKKRGTWKLIEHRLALTGKN